ncbi:MAG: hypothetical protein KatS3mg035_1348 [Bacteroidia bacterium]|nr:MAG: hypothetical protein KatS3mg035_1348 [Bacteroidia bacterium]
MKKLIVLFCLNIIILFAKAQERRLKNIRQLTFGGDNAEAYFSPDGSKLTLQVTNPELNAHCDQIFMLDLKNLSGSPKDLKLISTGKGRTTCSYFMPDGKHILYASTHEAYEHCPEPPKSYKGKYVWAIYPDFDIYIADLNGNIVKKLTDTPGYDAEAVVSPDGKKIVFTSMRNGDLDLYVMDIDGSNVKQITHELGYDGGAFFSFDSKKIVFRASRPKTPQAIQEYKELLSQNLVAPTEMEIFICDIDGSNMKQITHLGKANWAPFFHPSNKKIIFSSNHHSKKGYDFQLFMIDLNGENLEQITYHSEFNAFPMFSPDGKKLVFSSNRNPNKPRETNVFIADWIELPHNELPNPQNLQKHVEYLAADKLEGRLAGSKGETLAAKYIQKYFRSYGLKPFPNTKSYIQNFEYRFHPNPHQTPSEKDPKVQAKNVIGFLNNQSDKTFIIGAHYDHLGYNERGHSTAPNEKNAIHNGADDNASGTALLIELARLFAQNSIQEPVNFLFVAFSGEEDGLQGSKFFADFLIQNQNLVGKPVFMLNMDMVGRLDSLYKFHVHGVGTSEKLEELLQLMKPAGFQIQSDSSGIGPSDHTSFYKKNIPVLFFFTGLHTDYHKPSDDAHKINFYGMKIITEYIYNITLALSERKEFPFYKTALKTEKQAAKYKVSLGIMPDYKDYGDGLHVESVIEGRPAHAAGIQEGDIIMKIGDCEIKEVYSYMECLSKFNAGETTTITLKRKQEVITLKVQF